MALTSPERLQSGQKHDAAKVRFAGLTDAVAIAQLISEVGPKTTSEEVAQDLEQGGALLLDQAGTLLCALVWLEADYGWTLQQPAVLERYQQRELDRWVLTKLEALAIQRNIPTLKMCLDDDSLLPYYARMGYRREEEGSEIILSKRVGGTWQYKV